MWPATDIQRGILFEADATPTEHAYVVQQVYRIEGELDAETLQRALYDVFARHPTLRTGFVATTAGLMQYVGNDVLPSLASVDISSQGATDATGQLDAVLQRDLEAGFPDNNPPLLRATLIRFGPALEDRLLLTAHHAILDAWSKQFLVREVLETYDALTRGVSLADRPVANYERYCDWLASRDTETALAMWESEVGTPVAPTLLARRRPAPHSLLHVRTAPDARLVEQVSLFARQARVTPATIAAAAWALILARDLDMEQVAFAEAVTVRPPELDHMDSAIGLYLNTIPCVVTVDAEAPVEDWLARTHRQRGRLRAVAHVPFSSIRARLSPSTPLCDTLLGFQGFRSADAISTQSVALVLESTRQWTGFPLALEVDPDLSVLFTADARAFEISDVERLAARWVTALETISHSAGAAVGTLDVIPEQERQQLLVFSDGGAPASDDNERLSQLIQSHAASRPDSVAVKDPTESISYGGLEERASTLADELRKTGISEGDCVGVELSRSVGWVCALLAIWKIGAAYVPLDPAWPRQRREFVIRDCGLKVRITERNGEPNALRLVRTEGQVSVMARVDGTHDLAYVIYTSGSTGQPKGVPVGHRALANCAAWYRQASDLSPDDVCVLAAPVSFDASALELWPALSAGAEVLVVDEQLLLSPGSFGQWLASNGATVVFLSTPVAEAVLPHLPDRHSLRVVHTGGSRLSRNPRPSDDLLLLNDYGPTEATIVATSGSVVGSTGVPDIGTPIPGLKCFVLGSRRRMTPLGSVGELYIAGVGVVEGYLNRSELSDERFVEIPELQRGRMFRTGDLVRWSDSGHLHFVGRADNQLKLRGQRIEPGEIEITLIGHPSIDEAIVLAIGDTPRLMAFLVGEPETDEALRTFMRQSLTDAMIPSDFLYLETLPRTHHGKVDTEQLEQLTRASQASVQGEADVAKLTELERLLVEICARELGMRLRVDDDFYEHGVDSLSIMQLNSRIMEQLGHDVPLHVLIENPTIRQIAHALEAESGIARTPSS